MRRRACTASSGIRCIIKESVKSKSSRVCTASGCHAEEAALVAVLVLFSFANPMHAVLPIESQMLFLGSSDMIL